MYGRVQRVLSTSVPTTALGDGEDYHHSTQGRRLREVSDFFSNTVVTSWSFRL